MRPEAQHQMIGAFVDGELELARQLEMEEQLARDGGLRADIDEERRLRGAIREAAEYHKAPSALRSRLHPLDAGAAPVPASRPRRFAWPAVAWRQFAAALGLAGLLVGGWSVIELQAAHDDRLAEEAVASHVRATLGQRLVDVASSDQHTVKPWLSSKLDFSPPVRELPDQGVSLVGGRVDYLDGRPVAVLVYKKRQHVVDVFVWPAGSAEQAMSTASLRGFNVRHGAHAGMSYWIVSDLNGAELAGLASSFVAGGGAP
jgi:anti-sigma factor RsiW